MYKDYVCTEHGPATSASTARYTALGRLVNGLFVTNELRFLLEHARANVTREDLDVTNAMNRRQVPLHIAAMHQLLAANLALVFSSRMLRSVASMSMRRVVVSVDR